MNGVILTPDQHRVIKDGLQVLIAKELFKRDTEGRKISGLERINALSESHVDGGRLADKVLELIVATTAADSQPATEDVYDKMDSNVIAWLRK